MFIQDILYTVTGVQYRVSILVKADVGDNDLSKSRSLNTTALTVAVGTIKTGADPMLEMKESLGNETTLPLDEISRISDSRKKRLVAPE
jgi:hypothetical protein